MPYKERKKMNKVTGRTRNDLLKIKKDNLSAEIRKKRDFLIESISWRVERYNREELLNLVHKDNLLSLLSYIQTLADIPIQNGFPESIIWPSVPNELNVE